jgi:ATP-dependent Lon protease
MSETLTLPVLPLDDAVVLPGMVVPFDLSDPEARAAVEAARAPYGTDARSETKPRVLLVPRLNGKYAAVGTIGVIEQEGRLPGGEPGAVVRGVARVKIVAGTTGPGAALWVEGSEVEVPPAGTRADELAREYKGLVSAILQKRGAWQVVDIVQQIDDPSTLADNSGYSPYLSTEQKIEVLETTDVIERLGLVIGWARDHLAELDVTETIRKDVQEGMEKQQREFLLRQQLAAVRKELAELNGDPADEEEDYRARIEAADLPEKVREASLKEVEKLERSSDASPEGAWIRTWLDTVLDIPWNERTEDSYDIAGAREILDADHAGLDDVKERIIEYLAEVGPRSRRCRRPPLRSRAGVDRPARSGQDLAGRVGRAGDGTPVRPGRARWRPGRGGDPRSPAYVRRGTARPDRASHPRGGLDEPRGAAGRDRQGRSGLPGRPDRGAAGGAGPGAEPHLPGSLPGGRARPV